MTMFQLKNQPRTMSFEAMKLDISNTLQPIRRYLDRLKANNLPLTPGQVADMIQQLDLIDGFLEQLEMVDGSETGRRAVVSQVRRLPRA